MGKKLTIIGGYPPPYGGVSVHIQRLAEIAAAEFDVEIIDLYSDAKDKSPNVRCCGAKKPFNLFRAMNFLFSAGSDLVHFHVSAMGNFTVAGYPMLWSLRSRTQKIITIHSGSFAEQYQRSSAWQKKIFAHLLKKFDHVITVNGDQQKLLESMGISPGKISVIPAFLPPIVTKAPAIGIQVEELRKKSERLVLVSGYALRYYGFDVVLDAIDAIEASAGKPGVIFVFYNKYDYAYVAELEKRLVAGYNFRIYKDMSPEEFSYLLSLADIYVRATDRDGDAVALREAAYFGKQLIASDCVDRPTGVLLFETMTPRSLQEALAKALTNTEIGLVNFDFQKNVTEITNIYKKLTGCCQ